MKKRILSLVTALALCLGLLPGTAWAVEENVASVTVDGDSTSYYTDIAKAFQAASGKTATITLLADIKLTKENNDGALLVNSDTSEITLELDGKKLEYYANKEPIEGIIIISSGSLTIQDSSNDSTGLIYKNNGDGIKLTGGSLTVKSGTVKASSYAVRVTSGAKVTVDGGTVTGGTGIKAHSSTVFINGGVVSGNPGESIEATFGASVTVTGGFVESTKDNCFYNYNASITISGGFISSPSSKLDIPVDGTGTGTVSISGGWFSKQVDQNYCAEGYTPTTESETVESSPVENTNWYTVRQLPTYTVTFKTNGGTNVDSQTVIQDKTAVEPETPTRTGYTFEGWYTDQEYTSKYSFNAPVTADLTLYAKWTETLYTVTVTESAHGTASASPTTATMGTKVSLTATPESGYQFKEWQVTSGETSVVAENNAFTMPAGDVTVQAVFEVIPSRPSQSSGGSSTYSVTVEDAAHGTVKPDRTRASSGTTVTITVTPEDGYELDKLTVTDSRGNELTLTDKGSGKYTFRMPSGKVTVKPVFTAIETGHDCPSLAFTDLDVTAWYHEAVDYALENGTMSGYGGRLFGPDDSLSRAQLCQILYNREGKPTATESSPFTDVTEGAWYTGAITWANANGIVSGYPGNVFGPDDPITREQLAAILWRYAQFKGYNTTQGGMAIREFSDYETISGYAVDAMTWAVNTGVVSGYEDKTLRPQDGATRTQAAQMLMRFCELGK